MERREREEQEREVTKKIEKAKYKWYKWLREDRLPEYLERGRKEEKWKTIARFRNGNEMREGLY